MVIRGGQSSITFCAVTAQDGVRIKLWAVRTTPTPIIGITPADGTVVPAGWDPSLLNDFSQVGRVVMSKEFIMAAGSHPVEFKWRHKVQKIDMDTFGQGGQQLFWYWTVAQVSEPLVADLEEGLNFAFTHNLSFVGDALGTT